MANVVRLPARPMIAGEPKNPQPIAGVEVEGGVIAFPGIDFAEMRRIAEKYGLSTEGLPGAPPSMPRR